MAMEVSFWYIKWPKMWVSFIIYFFPVLFLWKLFKVDNGKISLVSVTWTLCTLLPVMQLVQKYTYNSNEWNQQGGSKVYCRSLFNILRISLLFFKPSFVRHSYVEKTCGTNLSVQCPRTLKILFCSDAKGDYLTFLTGWIY